MLIKTTITTVETAKKKVNLDWWNSLSHKKQKDYIKENPNSQYKKHLKAPAKKGGGKDEPSSKEKVSDNQALQDFNYNEQIQQQVKKDLEEPEKKGDGEGEDKKEFKSPEFDHDKMAELDKKIDGELKGVKKISQAIKNFHEDQKKFFKDKDYEENSEPRRTLGKLFKDKAKGIVKALKEEGEEWKHAASGMRAIVNGEKLNHHQKQAMKTVAVHAALVIGPAALSGGLSAGFAHALPHVIGGMLEHSLVMGGLKAAIWAAKEKDTKDMSEDELIEMLIEYMAKGAEKSAVSKRDWVKAMMKANALEKSEKAALIKSFT